MRLDFYLPFPREDLFSVGVEEKANIGTSAPLTVAIDLDPRLNEEKVVVNETFVPVNLQQLLASAEYSIWLKVTGETNEGEEIDLTMSRCEKCKARMRTKNKDEPDSPRFCDVVSSKIVQTRRKGGNLPNT